MSQSADEAAALLEPAASRVRDPASGRSVWLAGLITGAKIDAEVLEFTLNTHRQHSAEDRGRMQEAILRNLEGLGWKGKIVCNVALKGLTLRGVNVADLVEGNAQRHRQLHCCR